MIKIGILTGVLICFTGLISGYSMLKQSQTQQEHAGNYSSPQKDSLTNLLKYINALQGTNSTPGYSNGNTYPAIALPLNHIAITGLKDIMNGGILYGKQT